MQAALGVGSRPAATRLRSRKALTNRVQVPSWMGYAPTIYYIDFLAKQRFRIASKLDFVHYGDLCQNQEAVKAPHA